ncbi:MAG: GNAT family N-acetyltransferase [Saprospiraceae bacterium]
MDFILRPLIPTDAPCFADAANNPRIANNLTNVFPHPYTEADAEFFIQLTQKANPREVMAIVVAGKAVGAIGVHPQADIFCKNAEMGYWLAEPYWGKGIITEAIKKMVEYAFANFAIDRIFARPFGRNIGSQRVLEKAGFTLEGRLVNTIYKNGQYEDEVIYAIRR